MVFYTSPFEEYKNFISSSQSIIRSLNKEAIQSKMNTAIIFAAFFALTASAAVIDRPSVRTFSNGPDGSFVYSGVHAGSVAPGFVQAAYNFQDPTFKTINVTPEGYGYGTVGGLQGPSTRTVNIGPDGNVIDSFNVGGVVTDDGKVIAPELHSSYGQAVNQVFVQRVVPSVIPTFKSYVYAPVAHSGFVPIPYGKNIIAGPSGVIVAK